MKKLTYFFVLISFLAISSCTKDRVCQCTGRNGGADYEFTFAKSKKGDAVDGCKAYAENWSDIYYDCNIEGE